MRKVIVIIISGFFISHSLVAQDSRAVGSASNSKNSVAFNISSKQAAELLEVYQNHPFTIYYDNLIVEYEKRMRANVHKYKVMAR